MFANTWSAIIITCPQHYSQHFLKELKLRQHTGLIWPKTTVLAIEDPRQHMGSGGATLNALLVLAECLSHEAKLATISSDVLADKRVLIIHVGRILLSQPLGNLSLSLPLIDPDSALRSNSLLDLVLTFADTQLLPNSPNGAWICSSDSFIFSSSPSIHPSLFSSSEISMLLVESNLQHATKHGVCMLDEKNYVKKIYFKCQDKSVLKTCAIKENNDDIRVPLITGCIFMGSDILSSTLQLTSNNILQACTYVGWDSGVDAIKMSLFFDFALAMCDGCDKETFINGGIYGDSDAVGSGRDDNVGDGGGDDQKGDGEKVEKGLNENIGGIQGEKINNDVDNDEKIPNIGEDNNKSKTTYTECFVREARKLVYENLSRFKCKAWLMTGHHRYIGKDRDCYEIVKEMQKIYGEKHMTSWEYRDCCHVQIDEHVKLGVECVIMNSWIGGRVVGDGVVVGGGEDDGVVMGDGVVVMDSRISGDVVVGNGCYLNGVDLCGKVKIPPNTILIGIFVHTDEDEEDEDSDECGFDNDSDKTRCLIQMDWNGNISNVMAVTTKTTKIYNDTELWNSNDTDQKNKNNKTDNKNKSNNIKNENNIDTKNNSNTNSKNRFSVNDVLRRIDVESCCLRKRHLINDISCSVVTKNIKSAKPFPFDPLFKMARFDGLVFPLISCLDNLVGTDAPIERVLASISQLLGQDNLLLQNGPACNLQWKRAFDLLKKGEIKQGVKEMKRVREKWCRGVGRGKDGGWGDEGLGTSLRRVRAARHYEAATQLVVKHAVMTCQQFVKPEVAHEIPAMDEWVHYRSAARVDLSGGWSDIPIVSLHRAGAVCNVALKINGQKPIGAKMRRIKNLEVVVHLCDTVTMRGSDHEFLSNYDQPSAPGSLVKACMLSAGLFDLHSPLQQQLFVHGCGFEIAVFSDLPHGSGLGTSSILAGCLIACMWTCVGKKPDLQALIHCVLIAEQLLTTGGGWQDQVGGLHGGFKLGWCARGEPLQVRVNHFGKLHKAFVTEFNNKLVLIYTGQTRLGKNLLQNVLRRWFSSSSDVTKAVEGLLRLAVKCKEAVLEGDVDGIGVCMKEYWELKKVMAPNCEPRFVTSLITCLSSRCHGYLLTGAGGGGFMCLLTKQKKDKEEIQKIIDSCGLSSQAVIYEAEIDDDGIERVFADGSTSSLL